MMNTTLSGEYQIQVHRHDQLVHDLRFKNLILNQGRDLLGLAGLDSNDFLAYAQIGTGTSTPIPTQTQLDAFVGAAARSSAGSWVAGTAPDYKFSITFTYTFAKGAVIGNMSEVGVGRTSSTGNLFSRARIVDAGGNPTTIAVQAIDRVTVFYTLYLLPDTTNVTSLVTLDGVAYPYTAYNMALLTGGGYNNVSVYRPPFSVDTEVGRYIGNAFPTGTTINPATINTSTIITAAGSAGVLAEAGTKYEYTVGTYTGRVTVKMGPTNGTPTGGGIQLLQLLPTFMGLQLPVVYAFTNPIPKAGRTLTLVLTVNWSS